MPEIFQISAVYCSVKESRLAKVNYGNNIKGLPRRAGRPRYLEPPLLLVRFTVL